MNGNLAPKDFFETRQGVCKASPSVTMGTILLVKTQDLDINRTVREFARHFKTRLAQTHPHDDRKFCNSTRKTKTKTEFLPFPLTFEETET